MAHRFALRPVALGASVFCVVLALSIAGCGGGGGGSATPPAPPVPPPAGDGGGTAKILSAAKMINIGGSSIGAGTTGQPVSVAGDIVIPYTPGDITATGVFTGTCGGLAFTTTIKSSAPGTTTFAHAPWAHSVNCTGSVTYTFAGYTSATENYTWRTEDAPPSVAVVHPSVVLAFGPNWIHRVDPSLTDGIAPITNRSGREFYGYGIRPIPLADCRYQVSVLDLYTLAPFVVIYDRSKSEVTLDTSGTAPPRLVENYVFQSQYNPAYPTYNMFLQVGDEKYWNPESTSTLWYQNGVTPARILGTYPFGIKVLLALPLCTTTQ